MSNKNGLANENTIREITGSGDFTMTRLRTKERMRKQGKRSSLA
jgi:hypothetical protein